MSLAQVQPTAMIPGHGLTAAVAHLYLSLGTGNVGVIKGETIHLWENSSVVVTAAYAFCFVFFPFVAGVQAAVDLSVWEFFVFLQ